MIGKLIITAIILGGGAFLLLSDNFEEYVSPYASAAASDIENMKNDPLKNMFLRMLARQPVILKI